MIAYPSHLDAYGPETLPPHGATTRPIRPLELPERGDILAERYEVEEMFARGGMACIFRARHVGLDTPVAIKVLDPSILTSTTSDAAVRFTREARLASQLKHPGIVQIFDFGITDAGLPYIVMEYLEGESLGRLLAREAPLPWPRARDYTLQLLDALQVAHEAGMVHRDIKPENCFVVRGFDQVKMLDFGIAKVLHQAQRLTADGNILGTPHYLSPEQARATEVDERTDVYAVGVLLYEMVCGSCPFEEGSALEIVAAHINATPPPLAQRMDTRALPAGLQHLLDRTLAKNPNDRPRDARSLADAIRGLELGAAPRRHGVGRWLAVGTAAILIGIGAGGVAAWLSGDDETELVDPPVVEPPEIVRAAPSDPIEPIVAAPPATPEPPRDELMPAPADETPATPSKRTKKRKQARQTAPQVPKPKPVAPRGALQRAAAVCKKFAPPGGVRLRINAEIADDGTVDDVGVSAPYGGTPIGRCVERALKKATLPPGSASTFRGKIKVG